jgi:hypothetical protein
MGSTYCSSLMKRVSIAGRNGVSDGRGKLERVTAQTGDKSVIGDSVVEVGRKTKKRSNAVRASTQSFCSSGNQRKRQKSKKRTGSLTL